MIISTVITGRPSCLKFISRSGLPVSTPRSTRKCVTGGLCAGLMSCFTKRCQSFNKQLMEKGPCFLVNNLDCSALFAWVSMYRWFTNSYFHKATIGGFNSPFNNLKMANASSQSMPSLYSPSVMKKYYYSIIGAVAYAGSTTSNKHIVRTQMDNLFWWVTLLVLR